MTRRLLFVTGSRADFGLWLPLLRAAEADARLETALLATAMHLEPRHGETIEQVRAAGIRIAAEVPSTPPGDTAADMAAAVGLAIVGMAPVLERERPDWVLLLGDRGEQLAASIVAVHLLLPMAHVAGGDRTLGAVDDTARDMITRAAHLHFVTSQAAHQRLVELGEEAWRIRLVGSPGLDDLLALAQTDPGPVRARIGLEAREAYLLILQHPETRSGRDPVADLEAILQASRVTGVARVAVLPNADAGGQATADRLRREPGLHVVASLPRPEFVALLSGAAALLGNSSAGLTEAAMLRVPAVNVGERQKGRARGDNVIDTGVTLSALEDALRRALEPGFRAGLAGTSPHGAGGASAAIAEALATQPMDQRLLVKGSG